MGNHGPIDLPKLGGQTADTHAHLDMLDDPAGALERAAMIGVMFVATVVDVTESPQGTFDSLSSWLYEAQRRLLEWEIPHGVPPEVRIIVGAHPHNASALGDEEMRLLIRLAKDPRVAAIGEIGLDFHYDHSPRDAQRWAFRQQLEVAHTLGLPVVVHLREAHEEGLTILQQVGVPEAGCIIHCYTGDADLVERFVELGCYVSFAGPLTFKNADPIRGAAERVPLDRVLIETDSPFLAPEPHRGKTNEPAFVVLTAERLARVHGVDTSDIARATIENARTVLGRTRGN
ncbi:MAG: TatD family hydrolase [Actinomycetota bacterium]|jgi:TatD DNase family protein|nr:TatD family hydrolase [Actinomycetota bacterium]